MLGNGKENKARLRGDNGLQKRNKKKYDHLWKQKMIVASIERSGGAI